MFLITHLSSTFWIKWCYQKRFGIKSIFYYPLFEYVIFTSLSVWS
jgi:hypothetical protein